MIIAVRYDIEIPDTLRGEPTEDLVEFIRYELNDLNEMNSNAFLDAGLEVRPIPGSLLIKDAHSNEILHT